MTTPADTVEVVTEQRKGRSNAILTYDLLSEFDKKLTTIAAKFDALVVQNEDRKATLSDHELRIRLAETAITGLTSGRQQSRTSLDSAVQLAALGISTVSIIMSVLWHAH